jgi:hypothetical protein
MLNFIWSRRPNVLPAGKRSADFLKVTPVLGGREEQVNGGMLRPVPERVLCVTGNVDQGSSIGFDPLPLFAR